MAESKDKGSDNSYFKRLIRILMLVQMIDAFTTVFPGAIQSAIANDFLPGFTANEQDSIIAFASAIVSIGMCLLFFSQYLSDRLGRKKMLIVTVFGMASAAVGMFFSVNYVMYMLFVFIMYFFFSSDIWLIYINEEAGTKKRAYYSNIILMAGLIGPIFMVILRLIFIRGADPFWQGMTLFPILLGFPLCFIINRNLKETTKFLEMKESGTIESRTFKEDLSAIFKTENRKSYSFLLVIVFIRGMSGIYLNLFEKYIYNVGTITQDQVTIIFLLVIFAVFIAYAINGLLADRIGRKPLLYLWSFISPISVLLWVFGAYHPTSAFLIVLLGYALSHISVWGAIGVIRLNTIELLPTDRRGTGVGFRSLIGSIGAIIGLFLSSAVILVLGLGTTFLIFVMGNFIVIPIAYLYLKETKGVELGEIK